MVSFSGGMDSSFVLAIAAHIARAAGLPAPIPITWRFTGAPLADESGWQEKVIASLAITEWEHLHADDDLDLIGPVAQRILTRYGVLSPFNVHLHLPILDKASGGSLLTGLGGDQVLSRWRPPRPRTLSGTVRRLAPGHLVAAVKQHNQHIYPWLQPAAARQVLREHRSETHAEPRIIARRMAWNAGSRTVQMACSSLHAIADEHNVRVIHPLLDQGFLASLREHAAKVGSRTRAELMLDIAGDTLPPASIAFRPKAHFLEVFLREPTHEFVRSWDGRGADVNVVNVAALQQLWQRWPIPPGTAGLVQQLWLASRLLSPSMISIG
jgi:asparagine synthase (glutamine-hydrolysing)